MAYSKKEWISEKTKILAEDMERIEEGIAQNERELGNKQPKGDYPTREEVEGFAQPKGDYLSKDEAEQTYQPKGSYATEDFVTGKIAEAQLGGNGSGGGVDLSAYAKSEDVAKNYQPKGDYITAEVANENYQPKGTYLTEHQKLKTINGQSLVGEGNIEISGSGEVGTQIINYDFNVKAVNHRGYSKDAPENTIPAYIMSKQKGFRYAECDVSFTSDGVCVLLHDSTIDRTSDGSGNISAMTYEQANQYDYGSWKSADYTGTHLATLDEFLLTCKRLGMHPYIEIKKDSGTTQEMVQSIVSAVKVAGMKGKVTYISFNDVYLGYVKTADTSARLGYVVDAVNSTVISTANGLKTEENEVFIDANYTKVTDAGVMLCINADLPLEVWTVNDENWFESMNPYISGVTSDFLRVGERLYELGMIYDYDNSGDSDEPTVEEVITLYSSDIKYRYGLKTEHPYYEEKPGRASYVDFDIIVNSGYKYKFVFESASPTTQMGVQAYSKAGMTQVKNQVMVAESYKFDPGWQENGAEIEFPADWDGGSARITFRADQNNSDVPDGMITKLTITRTKLD